MPRTHEDEELLLTARDEARAAERAVPRQARVEPEGPDAPQVRLFDFGPDLVRPVDAPVAALPPWMRADRLPARAPEPASLGAAFTDPISDEHGVPESTNDAPTADEPTADEPTAAETTAPSVAHLALPAAPQLRRPRPRRSAPAIEPVAPAATAPPRKEPLPAEPTRRQKCPARPSAPAVRGGRVARRRGRRLGPARVARNLAILVVGSAIGIAVAGGLPDTGSVAATEQAGAWVQANLDRSSTLLAPPALAADLTVDGRGPSAVVTYPDTASGWETVVAAGCCEFVLVTGPDTAGFRPGLAAAGAQAYDRSRMVAAFVADGERAEVRRMMDGTPSEVAAALRSAQERRVASGADLVETDGVSFTAAARGQALAGDVDSRVLGVVDELAERYPVSVAAFPAQPGEGSAEIPRRTVAFDLFDGDAVRDGAGTVTDATEILAAQQGAGRPAAVGVTTRAGRTVFEVRFDLRTP